MQLHILISCAYPSISVLIMPWFYSPQKVNHLDLISKVLVGRQVGVTSIRVYIVREGDVFADVPVGPGTEVCIKETLVSSVKGTVIAGSSYQRFVCFYRKGN